MKPIEKLKNLIDESGGQTKFAQELGLKRHLIINFLNGTQASFPDELAKALEKKYKIPYQYWKTGEGSPEINPEIPEESCTVPLITASAGNGYELQELNTITVAKKQLNGINCKNVVCCEISGSSMSPVINDKDIVIINKEEEVKDGDIIVVSAGNRLLCKKILIGVNYIILKSLNPDYEPEPFRGDERENINIVGKVIYRMNKF